MAMESTAVRRRKRGFRLDGAALDRELAARGLRPEDLARLAQVSEDTVSRARRGGPIDRVPLHKIAAALEAVPIRPVLARLAAGGGPK